MSAADHLPISSKGEFLAKAAALGASAFPVVGLIPQGCVYVGDIIGQHQHWWLIGNGIGVASIATLSPFFASRAKLLWGAKVGGAQTGTSNKEEIFDICGMKFPVNHLYTNVLITGTIGTGKTSTAIFPILEQMFLTYTNENTRDPKLKEDPFLKLGGISLDVKGEFYQAVLFFANLAKRNVLEDIQIIRPNIWIPVVKFMDIPTKRYFYLSALETSFGSECKQLIDGQGPNFAHDIPTDVFSYNAARRKPYEDKLKSIDFGVAGLNLRYVGWRQDGSRLVRVLNTPGYEQLEYATGPRGGSSRVYEAPPTQLRYVAVEGVDNMLRYNLVNPDLPPSEVAKRLTNIAKLLDPDKGSGDNPYFEKEGSRLMGVIIDAWRLVYDTRQITGPDIIRIATASTELRNFVVELQKRREITTTDITRIATANTELRNWVEELKKRKEIAATDIMRIATASTELRNCVEELKKRKEIAATDIMRLATAIAELCNCVEELRKKKEITGPDIMRIATSNTELRNFVEELKKQKEDLETEEKKTTRALDKRDIAARIRKLTDHISYLMDTWEKLEPKTKSIVQSVVGQMFGEFLTDNNLQESFCSPATYSFDDCISKGTFFCFVPGRDYEATSRVMGTALKTDFQSRMLARPSMSRMNKSRKILKIIDECHIYAVAGGSTGQGDENFNSLSRQSNVINVDATQSDASLISVTGKDKADVYLQSYGGRVWFQNSNERTNESAAKLCGKLYREFEKHVHQDDFSMAGTVGLKNNKVKRDSKFTKVERFPPERFATLNTFESITFNKGHKGEAQKAVLKQNKPHYFSGPDNSPKVATLMRWYIQAYPENLAFKQGKSSMFDTIIPGENDGAVSPVLAPEAGTAASSTPASGSARAVEEIEEIDEREEAKKAKAPTPSIPPATDLDVDANSIPPLRERKPLDILSPRTLLIPSEDDLRTLPPSPSATRKPPPETKVAQDLPGDIRESFRNGKVSMAQMRKLDAFFKDQATQIELGREMAQTLLAEPLYNPQQALMEAAANAGRAGTDPTASVTSGPRGRAAGEKPQAPNLLKAQDGEESLDLARQISKNRIELADQLKSAAKAALPPATALPAAVPDAGDEPDPTAAPAFLQLQK